MTFEHRRTVSSVLAAAILAALGVALAGVLVAVVAADSVPRADARVHNYHRALLLSGVVVAAWLLIAAWYVGRRRRWVRTPACLSLLCVAPLAADQLKTDQTVGVLLVAAVLVGLPATILATQTNADQPDARRCDGEG